MSVFFGSKERIEIIDSIEDEIAVLRQELDMVGAEEEAVVEYDSDEKADEAEFDENETEPIEPIE